MALKKVRGFNRGKSNLDYRAIAGDTHQMNGERCAIGKGARWDVDTGGTLQRSSVANSSPAYPGHTGDGGASVVSYIEDFGALSDLHAAGGYSLTFYARRNDANWFTFRQKTDGTLCAPTSLRQYRDVSNFFELGDAITIPGSGTGTQIYDISYASTGEVVCTDGALQVSRWDSLENPTTSLSFSMSGRSLRPRSIIYQGGFYYTVGNNGLVTSGHTGGAILRGSQFVSATSFAPQFSSQNIAFETVRWMPSANCFLALGATNPGSGPASANNNTTPSIGQATIYRSTNGITWTPVYVATQNNTYIYDVIEHPTSNLLVVVGASGYIVTSGDAGLTWTPRTSNVPTNQIIVCAMVTPDNLLVGFTNFGNTVVSSDGLTWTYQVADFPIGIAATWSYQSFVYNDELYVASKNYTYKALLKYVGEGRFAPIMVLNNTPTNSTVSVFPAGTFFADSYSGTGVLTGGNNMTGVNMTNTGLFNFYGAGSALWASTNQFSTATDTNWHKIQIVGTALTGSANPSFSVQTYIDDSVSGAPVTATASSATQHLWFCTAGTGFNMFSDIVMNDFSGTRNNAPPTGDVQIRSRLQVSDATTPQWLRVPETVANNALAAQGDGSIISAPSSVQSDDLDQTDQYTGATWATPAGYRISGVGVTTAIQRLGVPTPTVELSMIEGGSSLPVASATADGATTAYVPATVLYETKVDEGVWTDATLNSSTIQLKRST